MSSETACITTDVTRKASSPILAYLDISINNLLTNKAKSLNAVNREKTEGPLDAPTYG